MALLFGDGLAYEWGTDWPETFDVLSMSKQHRPLSQKLSPLGVMEELNKLYYMGGVPHSTKLGLAYSTQFPGAPHR